MTAETGEQPSVLANCRVSNWNPNAAAAFQPERRRANPASNHRPVLGRRCSLIVRCHRREDSPNGICSKSKGLCEMTGCNT